MKQPYLVMGGELINLDYSKGISSFKDNGTFHLVGMYFSLEEASKVWRAYAQQTVDNALMRYIIYPLNDVVIK